MRHIKVIGFDADIPPGSAWWSPQDKTRP